VTGGDGREGARVDGEEDEVPAVAQPDRRAEPEAIVVKAEDDTRSGTPHVQASWRHQLAAARADGGRHGASRGGGHPLVRDGARVGVPAPVEGKRLQRKATVTDEQAQPVPLLLRVPPHGQDVEVERDQAPDEGDGRECGDVVGRQRRAVGSRG